MRSIAIITDSTADLPVPICSEYGITVVPLELMIGSEAMRDGTLTQAEFFARMNAADELPTTSQPPVGTFVEVYRRALETASHVVSVHISEKLSGTLASARTAAKEFEGRVTVVDSMNLSWGLGFQVIEAARASAQGLDVTAIVERVEAVRDRVQMIVHVDALDNLVRGGRISGFAGKVGGMLSVKLSFTVRNGEFVLVRPFRNAKAAMQHGLDWAGENMGKATHAAFAVGYAMAEDRAQSLKQSITERFNATEMYIYEAGTVIATHTGTGWAIAFVPED